MVSIPTPYKGQLARTRRDTLIFAHTKLTIQTESPAHHEGRHHTPRTALVTCGFTEKVFVNEDGTGARGTEERIR